MYYYKTTTLVVIGLLAAVTLCGIPASAATDFDTQENSLERNDLHREESSIEENKFNQNLNEFDQENFLDETANRVIFPGTKWCGQGNKSSHGEIGLFAKVDSCCRDHDKCDDVIEAHGSKHGLTNTTPYTRLACKCDERFRQCLKNAKSKLIGPEYFKVQKQCYRFDYPIVKCVKYRLYWIWKRRCQEYQLDKTAAQKYQWFDLPLW